MLNTKFLKLIQTVLFFTFLPFLGLAQDTTAIKLRASLDTVSTHNRRVDIWVELANVISDQSVKEAHIYLDSAKGLAHQHEYVAGIASLKKARGSLFILEGKYAPALKELGHAQTMFRELNDSLQLAKTYLLLGNMYSISNNFKEALRYNRNAGALFGHLKDAKSQAAINNNIGGIYWKQGKLDSASLFFNKSLLTYLEFGDHESLAANYTNIGIIYAERNELSKAIEYYEKSNESFIKKNKTYGQSVNYLNISDAYLQLGDYTKADYHLKKAIKIAKKSGYKSLLIDEYYTVGEIREAQGSFKEALTWYRESELLKDSLMNSETNAALLDLQTSQLEQIQKRELEKIRQINEGELKSSKLKNTLLLLISGFVLILLLVATFHFYKRAKAARKINTQNIQILNQKSKIYEQAKSIAEKNESLLVQNGKLEKLDEEKNYIMNVVAHDLKSPLNQIQGLTQVIKLEEGLLSKSQSECLTKISTSSKRLSLMINRILETRAIGAENTGYKASNVKLLPILTSIIANFKPLADQKKISIIVTKKFVSTTVVGDKHYIEHSIENILSNAIKFSPPHKMVEISLVIKNNKAIISFKDYGQGLTEEDHKNLFVEYANLSAKPTGNETSTGLGLAIVKKYVDIMEGDIWCESTSSKGATFYLAFNLAMG